VQLTVSLEKIARTGSLEITCDVDNAMIYLDGNYQKRTSSNRSVTITNIQEGSYELLVIKDGYQDYNSTVRIYPDRISRINVQMQWEYQEQKDGSIAVYCNENNARIFINGIYAEMTSANQTEILDELKEDIYEITVIKDGYRIWQEKASVYPGETTSIFVDLIKVENI
jgi:membrane carboxypeptidase/penicillin-binding protein PbpC